eukprot:6472038-Pyramimonas_sp.AAC.1
MQSAMVEGELILFSARECHSARKLRRRAVRFPVLYQCASAQRPSCGGKHGQQQPMPVRFSLPSSSLQFQCQSQVQPRQNNFSTLGR